MQNLRYVGKNLFVEKLSIKNILKKNKTPFYIYSENQITFNFLKFANTFKKTNPLICFAAKSNSNSNILRILGRLGAGADVVSGGELLKALKAGIKPNKIVFSGVGKTEEELKIAINKRILLINCKSESEAKLINNLAKKLNYAGNLLIINSDQFLYFQKTIFENGLKLMEESDGVLFSYEVNSNDLYGALEIKDGLFKGVIANNKIERNTKMKTYTGMSLWNLEKMDQNEGRSYFFDSVANAEKKVVKVVDINDFEYWDFGTLKRYYNSMFEILSTNKSAFKEFLVHNKALDDKKIGLNCYNSKSGINLSGDFINNCFKSIYMASSEILPQEDEKSIIRFDLVEHIDSV